MGNVLLVFIGGGMGAASRYGTTLLSARLFGTAFPWGTLLVNWAGCLLIGIVFALAERTQLVHPSARLFAMTGFLGGLTTFSTFGLESVNAVRDGEHAVLLYNVLLNNAGGMLLVALGMSAIRWIK